MPDAELLRELLSRGFLVVLQQRLEAGSTAAHFCALYADGPGYFLVSDPLRLSTAELLE